MKNQLNCIVRIATSADQKYAEQITDEMAYSAEKRGTGIARRPASYAIRKMTEGLAVVAINPSNGEWIGFCCLEVWDHQRFAASSGLIISPKYRGMGIASMLKAELFYLCRKKFPKAKLFSLTTNPAVIHANIELGYKVVSFNQVLKDPYFINGCHCWVDFPRLMDGNSAHAGYIAMIFDPVWSLSRKVIFKSKWQQFIDRARKPVGLAVETV